MPTRILITGCRHWQCEPIARQTLESIRSRLGGDFVLIHGDCPTGVDRVFRDQCEALGIEQERHPADWSLGLKAGPVRNETMTSLGADYAIAVHRTLARSKGTRDCVRRCLARGIATYLIDGVNPTRRVTEEDLRI